MLHQALFSPLFLRRTRVLTLRRFSSRSATEVRAMLERGSALARRILLDHSSPGDVVSAQDRDVDQRYILGGEGDLTGLRSYVIGGIEVLVVWTWIEDDTLHILLRRSGLRARWSVGVRGWRPNWPWPPIRPWVAGM